MNKSKLKYHHHWDMHFSIIHYIEYKSEYLSGRSYNIGQTAFQAENQTD